MSAPLLLDDAHTVAHLWVDGGVIKDTKGNVWTEYGALTRVARGDLGFASGAQAEGVSGFSDTNYLELASGAADIVGSYWIVAIGRMPAANPGVNTAFLSNGVPNGLGNCLAFTYGTNIGQPIAYLGGTNVTTGEAAWGDSFLSTLSMEGSSYPITSRVFTSSAAVYLNPDSAVYSNPNMGYAGPATSIPTRLGKWTDGYAGIQPWAGTIFEIRFSNAAPSNSEVVALHNSIIAAEYAGLVSKSFDAGSASKVVQPRFLGGFHLH